MCEAASDAGKNMKLETIQKSILIAGNCGTESRANARRTTHELKKRKGITAGRYSLWKPRTQPGGFEGLGESGLPILSEAARMGVRPATEVLSVQQAEKVMDEVLGKSEGEVIIWIGSRNQNHQTQQDIGALVSGEPRVTLMVKNQPWPDKRHSLGIVEHVMHKGEFIQGQLILCHRGVAPNGHHNPHGYRNIPNFEEAIEIKEESGFPMIFDPSHTGGSVENVFRITEEAAQYPFDGLIVEVHHDRANALSDAKQQLTWEELDALREITVYARG